MKKNFYFLSAALAALCLASCAKEQLVNEEGNTPTGNVIVFSATTEGDDADESKTYISTPRQDGSYAVRWVSGEYINVNGIKSAGAVIVDGSYNTKANFKVEMEPADTYYAISPAGLYSNGTFNSKAKTMDVFVKADAQYKTNGENITYDPTTALIVACSTTTTLSFQHMMAYYKITVTGEAEGKKIRKITVSQNGSNPNIAGVYKLTFSDQGDITMAAKTQSKLITYDCGEDGVALNTPMMIALPSVNFTQGVTFTIYYTDGTSQAQFAKTLDLSSARGKVIAAEFPYREDTGLRTIKSAADWEAFAIAVQAANRESTPDPTALEHWLDDGVVTLEENITLPGDFTRVAGSFNYTFDGGNHTITIEDGQHALFYTLGTDGVIKNLVTAGTMVNGNSEDGVTVLVNSLYGTIQDCTNNAAITVSKAMNIAAAPFAKIANHGVISGCVNNGNITVTCDATEGDFNAYAGGIVARILPSGVDGSLTAPAVHIVNCTNNGKIEVTLNNTKHKIGYAGYGGITGWVARNYAGEKYPITIFEGCTNTGAITVTNTDDRTSASDFAVCLGGIMGIGWGDYLTASDAYHLGGPTLANNQNKIYFKNCTNSGKLTNNTTCYCTKERLYAKSYVGGIAGSMFGFKSVFDDEENQTIFDGCVNSGNISGFSLTAAKTSITRNGLMSVAGGLLGIGANVSFKNCMVTGTIGNTNRIVFAVSGGIGVAAGKFRFDGCTFYPKLIMLRAYKTAKDNWTLLASYPKYTGTTKAGDSKMKFAGGDIPAITGSVVKNCHLGVLGCSANIKDVAWDYTEAFDLIKDVGKIEGSKFNNLENTETFSVQGTDQSSATYCGKTSDVTFTDNVYQNSAPALTTAAPAPMALTAGNTYNY